MSQRSPRPTGLASDRPPISYVWETPNRRPRRAEWDIPDPAAPGRLTPAMRAKLERIVRRAPEVMVKITGRTKDVAHLKSHLAYITRNGELDAETEQGATLAGRLGLKDLQQRWEDDAGLDGKRRRDGSLSINIILSMPAGTDAAAVKESARAFAIETFGDNHDYVFVQHLDDKHPHVHLTSDPWVITASVSIPARRISRAGGNGLRANSGFEGSRRRQRRGAPVDGFERPIARRSARCASERLLPMSTGSPGRRCFRR
jgi:Relaxase/Mobilisation nuclease domain